MVGYVPPSDERRCVAKIRKGPKQGQRCTHYAIAGGTVCTKHGGRTAQTKRAAKRRLAMAAVDAEVARYAGLLGETTTGADVDPAAELLRMLAVTARRRDLLGDLIAQDVAECGADVLWGNRDARRSGGRLLVEEQRERERVARFAKLALDAGIAERLVRVAEAQTALVEQALRAALAGLPEDVQRLVLERTAVELRAIAG